MDGFEVNADYIAYLSPAEIDKVSVLKDGAALSIFGDRGANGVIWIETKRGEIGPASVSASVHYGIQQATTYAKPLDSYGYATLYNRLSATTTAVGRPPTMPPHSKPTGTVPRRMSIGMTRCCAIRAM